MSAQPETIYDVIVIGGGPAGYAAALYAARANFSVLVLEKLSPGGQMATTDRVDNYPGFPEGIDGFELAMKMKEGAERFGAETRLAEVTGVQPEGPVKEVLLPGETLRARTVIFAAGARPRELGLPGEKQLRGRGVSYCATCDGMFFRGKTVCVVGGGNTAVSDVLYLSRLCGKVYLIHRRDQLRASRVYLEPLRRAENVEFVWNSRVEELLAEQALTGVKVRDVLTGALREIPCAGVFLAIGHVPESSLLEGWAALDEAGYVLADETTRVVRPDGSPLPGVFAVGDLRAKPLRQIVTAVSDGATAARGVEEYLVFEYI